MTQIHLLFLVAFAERPVTLPDPARTSRFDRCTVTFHIAIKALLMLELFPQCLSIMQERQALIMCC